MAKLYFYYSSMNAGKTTTLLQASYNYRERGMTTVIFTPAFDDRFAKHKVVSRIGVQSDAVDFDQDFDFVQYFEAYKRFKKAKMDCILLDEAQFLSEDQVEQLAHIVDFHDLPVLCYGLRTNHMGYAFEGSKHLLAIADELVELKAICHCGRKANMTLKVDEDGQVVEQGAEVEIGGNERYISVCRKHFYLQDTGKFVKPKDEKPFNYMKMDES